MLQLQRVWTKMRTKMKAKNNSDHLKRFGKLYEAVLNKFEV